jgi:hypothetical protein
LLVSFVAGQIPQRNNLKEGRFVLAHGFSFQSMVSWLCCFWVMVKQNIMVEGWGGAELLNLWKPETRGGQGRARYALQRHGPQ